MQLGCIYFCELMPVKDQKPPELHHGATGAVGFEGAAAAGRAVGHCVLAEPDR